MGGTWNRGGCRMKCVGERKETDWGISQVNFFSIFIFEDRGIWIMWGRGGRGRKGGV